MAAGLLHAGTAGAATIVSEPKDEAWKARHEAFLQEAKTQKFSVVFLGDSITDYWRNAGQKVWEKQIAPLKAANFGIGGDRVGNVWWRVQHGTLDGIHPEAIVLLIGTNNLPDHTVDEIVNGTVALVEEIVARAPQSKLLILGMFPRWDDWSAPFRDKIPLINERVGALADGSSIYYLDFGSKFLGSDGTISKKLMPDGLHLSDKGYALWADEMLPVLKGLLH